MNKQIYTFQNSGFFLQKENDSIEVKKLIIESLKQNKDLFNYDQYLSYYYADLFTHKAYCISRIEKLINANNGDWIFFYEITNEGPFLLGVHLSKWDEEHYGFKMSNVQIFSSPEIPASKDILKKLLNKLLEHCKNLGVKYISGRVNGDNISALHSMEDVGFRYYDNVVWPITAVKNIDSKIPVRLMNENEVEEVKRISENFQYPRGHFYCDSNFDKRKVNAMYTKWIDTSVGKNEPIAVIEVENKIAGFFAFRIDKELQEFTGYKYGRLKLLALDASFRGKGVGSELFNGTLSLIKSMGVDYIDSGYSTKNHVSARLHTKASFLSVYEEVTFHLWIS